MDMCALLSIQRAAPAAVSTCASNFSVNIHYNDIIYDIIMGGDSLVFSV